jgi:hypothetical protein
MNKLYAQAEAIAASLQSHYNEIKRSSTDPEAPIEP